MHHQGGDRKTIKIPWTPSTINYERSLSSLLDDMNKEKFIGTVILIFLLFFSSGKASKEKRKKDRERYCNRFVRNINLLFNNSFSEFIYDINDYSDSCGKMADDGVSPASPS